MSGYFVHGGTQYSYSQTPQQAAPTNLSDLSYQQTQQTSQLYQSAAYPTAQSSRTTLQAAKPVSTYYSGANYGTQSLTQGYAAQRSSPQNYTSLDSARGPTTYGQSAINNSLGRTSYNTGSYGSPSLGAVKQEHKYSGLSGNSYGGYKSTLGGSSLNSSSSLFPSQPAVQQSNYSTSYPVSASYNKPVVEEASSSQYSYEKALYVAANQYYLSKKAEQTSRGGRGGGNRGRGGRGRGGGGGGRGGSSFGQSMGPKVIKATEVKAYLYAWCGQRRLKPEYSIEPLGMPPKMKFKCTLHITGLDHVAQVTAASKKDSQSKAAWDFCEHLVKTGYMKQAELPPKPEDPTPKNMPPKPSTPAGTEPETADSMEESGGWSLENCRQRLNQFTQRWRIPAEFKHETHGPEHARTFVAELTVKVKWLNKEFVAKERGNNKKQATAVCALAMVRQLFKEGLIEKQGDPIKHPRRPSTGSKEPNGEEKPKKPEQSTTGTKRKAEEAPSSEEVNEYGNWTLEEGRQRLHMFCQSTNQPFDIKYTPDGNVPPKMFTASVTISVTIDDEKKSLEKSHTCQGKKAAAQHCALEMVKELYQMSFIEANMGQQNKKKNARQRNQMDIPAMPVMEGPPFAGFMPPPMFTNFGPFGGVPQRRTPYDDAVILEKHRRIYPTELELTLIQKTVRTVEAALKQVSDQLASHEVEVKQEASTIKKESGAEDSDSTAQKDGKRILQGVMRVGALAKGLLLKGDLSAELVLLCVEIPTVPLLTKISTLLSKNFEDSGDKYLVDPRVGECVINVTSSAGKDQEKVENLRCNVRVHLTSPAMRTLSESATGPADMLDRDSCIKSLAELRHAKWFQACANGIAPCVVLLRIFKDMRRRISTWAPLSEWAIELLVEKALRTSFGHLSVGDGLRRVLSCISSGILLEDGPGICDPCEKDESDVIVGMSLQEREDITESAHHALRMLVYRQTHKILGIEPIAKRTSSEGESGRMDTST